MTKPTGRPRGRPHNPPIKPAEYPAKGVIPEPKAVHAANPLLSQIPVTDIEFAPLVDPEERKAKFISVTRAEKYWITQARNDPAMFCHYITGKQPAKHHLIWLKQLFDFTAEGRATGTYRLNFIAPRDSAKSTILMLAECWFMSRFPFTSNMIISVSASQAQKRIEMIRDIINHDVRYKNVFPHVHVDENQRNNIQEFSVFADALYDLGTGLLKPISYKVFRSLVKRVGSPKDPTIFSSGIGGKGVIGRRISGILIMDDIIDDAFLKSDMQNDVYDYIMRTLIPCVQENAKVVNIGTRWMPDDVPEKLKNNPEWRTTEIQAIRYNDAGEPMSYWPDYWPLEKLEAKRREMDNDALFKVMYLNDPTAFSDAKFTVGGISQGLPNPLPAFTKVIIGTDFAISTKFSADWTVFTAIGVDKDKNLYILDCRRIKATPDVVVRELGAFTNYISETYGRLDHVLIENVAFQSAMKFMIYDKFSSIPVIPITPVGDKGHRASSFAQKSNESKVFYNKEMDAYKHLKSETMNFGLIGVKDDIIDSISIVVQFLGSSIQNVAVRLFKSPLLL